MNIGAILNKINQLERRLAGVEHLKEFEVIAPLQKDEIPGRAGGIVLSIQEATADEGEFWARVTSYDPATGFYEWLEATPIGPSTFEDKDAGREGSLTESPLYQSNGVLLDVDSHVLIKRAFFDDLYSFVHVTDSVSPIDDPLIITNTRGSTIEQFGIVGLGGSTVSPQDDYATFAKAVYIDSAAPGTGARFAIVLREVANGYTSPAVAVGGPVQVKVDRPVTSHDYAGSTSGNYDYLTSGTSGYAEIMSIDDLPAAAIGLTVYEGEGVPSDGLGSDGDYYKDTDAEQYYGPKTAGAWGSAHDYGTGICWAVVAISLPDASVLNRGLVSTSLQKFAGHKYLQRTDYDASYLTVENVDSGSGDPTEWIDYKSDSIICSETVFPYTVDASSVIALNEGQITLTHNGPSDNPGAGGVRLDLDPASGAFGVGFSARCTLVGYRVTTGGDKPSYAVVDSTVGPSVTYVGVWESVAGLDFRGGLYTGGAFLVTVPSGGTGATSFTANQIIVGNGTSAMASVTGTKVVSNKLQLKGDTTDDWYQILPSESF